MTVQEYGLKFNQLSQYALHMVADSRASIKKFLYGVSDLVKTECRSVMLLGYINMSSLIMNDQKVEGDKLREQDKENKKSKTGNYDYSHRNRVMEIACRASKSFQLPPIRRLVFHTTRKGITRKGRATSSKSQESVSGTKIYPTCPMCGKIHLGERHAGKV